MREAQLDKVYNGDVNVTERVLTFLSLIQNQNRSGRFYRKRMSQRAVRTNVAAAAETFTAAGTCTRRPPIIESRLVISLQRLAHS